jgi:hemerythrin-like domain-containing protein
VADTMGSNDALDLLTSDHRRAETLFSQAGTRGSEAGREGVVRQIIEELSIHAAVEEQVLYPVVRREVPDGEQLADHSIEEHQEVKETLARLEDLGPGSPEAGDLLQNLITSVRQHVQEEESRIFPMLRSTLRPETLEEMGEAITKAKKMAPTHPHPKAPSKGPGAAVAGAAAGVADKVRDALKRD